MTKQPTLARTVPAETFFYVEVCADRDQAENEIAEYVVAINARSYQIVHLEPRTDDEECDVAIFVVYASALPSTEVEDHIADMYTMPHLVNAPIFDIDDLT